jgi:hypothetical protein
VFTDQMKGSETVAQLPTGDFSLVLDNPPTATPNSAVGFMTANGLANIEGDLTITGIGKSPDGKTILDLEGSVSAAGQDSNNNNVTLTGTFKAPVCD